jgi:tRNA A37 N6-isopentenylltransferase MiaA
VGDVEAMKRRTRNYAKRQLAWMRRLERANVLDAGSGAVDRLARLVKEEEKDS